MLPHLIEIWHKKHIYCHQQNLSKFNSLLKFHLVTQNHISPCSLKSPTVFEGGQQHWRCKPLSPTILGFTVVSVDGDSATDASHMAFEVLSH